MRPGLAFGPEPRSDAGRSFAGSEARRGTMSATGNARARTDAVTVTLARADRDGLRLGMSRSRMLSNRHSEASRATVMPRRLPPRGKKLARGRALAPSRSDGGGESI